MSGWSSVISHTLACSPHRGKNPSVLLSFVGVPGHRRRCPIATSQHCYVAQHAEAYCQHTAMPRSAVDEQSFAVQAAFLQELAGVRVPLAPLIFAGHRPNFRGLSCTSTSAPSVGTNETRGEVNGASCLASESFPHRSRGTHFHRLLSLHTRTLRCSSWGGRGNSKNLTLGLDGTNPRFPWKPSATMLIYRLTGTTEASGSTTTNATSLRLSKRRQQEQPAPNLRAPRCASKTAPHC